MKYATNKLIDRYESPSIYYYSSCRGNYSTIEEYEFDTFEEAVKEAKKTAAYLKKDVEVWAVIATVKFPEPVLEVVMETETEEVKS